MKPQFVIPVVLGLALLGCADESPEKHLASAKAYLQKNEIKAAVIEIKNALQKNRDLGEARYLLGSTLLKEGNPVAAEVELRKALAVKYPEDLVVPELARSMLMLGQAKKVVDEFGDTQFDKPTAEASLQTTLTMAYASLDKPEQAQAALRAALVADPKYVPALLLSARQKAATRDFEGAIALTEQIIAAEPANPDAWKLKGDLLLYTQNQPEDALAAYRKALEIEPKFAQAHLAILSVLMQQGKLDEATTQLKQLKLIAAESQPTRFAEAQLAYQKKDFKLARDLTQQLLQQAPKDPRLLQLAGAVELQAGSAAQAEIYLSNALQAAPNLGLARHMLIVAYLRSGQPAKALTTLNAAAGKDGLPPALYSLAGQVYLHNGDAKRAEEFFSKALKLDPQDARKRTALTVTQQLVGGPTDSGLDELRNIADTDSGVTADLALISAHLRLKSYGKALAAIDKLEAKQPDKPIAANLRGRVHLLQKDPAAARKSFERALAIDPSYFAAAASLASMDLADKRPDDARKRLESVLAKNPKNEQALIALAQIVASTSGNKDEVAALLTKAIDANPTERAPRLLLINLHLRNNDKRQALEVAQASVIAVPNNPDLLAALARAQQASGDLNQAIATYGKLVAMQPLSPDVHVLIARAHVANKNNQAAEESLHKALEIKADALDAQRELIALHLMRRSYQDALKVARQVQAQRPNQAAGYLLEGDVENAQRNWVGAASAYRKALQHGDSPTTATRLHAVLLASGKKTEADNFASTWMKNHPKDAEFRAYEGELALARKDYVAAEKAYLGVLSLHPESVIALNNLAWIAGQLRKDSAIGYAEKANKLAPNQPAFMDTLAMLLAENGDFGRAIDLQKKALALQPGNAGLQLNLARIYIMSGDKVRAKGELEALTKSGQESRFQAEASALLKTLGS